MRCRPGVALAGLLVSLAVGCGTSGPREDRVTAERPRRAAAAAAVPERDPAIGDPDDATPITRVYVASAVDGAAADTSPKRARLDQAVTLYAVIVTGSGAGERTYTDAPALRVRNADVAIRPLAQAPAAALRWRKVEPVEQTMSNTASGEFRFETIAYRATAMPAESGRGAIAADVHPTLTPDHGDGVGTMRFQIEVTQSGRAIASAGAEAKKGRGAGGLTDDVHRISLRRDDTYLGYLTELYGQPYIWASAGTSDRSHQSEQLEGCDCADFVVYGQRRMGNRLAYTWTGALPEVTALLAKGNRAADGVYRDAHGAALPFTGAGDLILFPRHVGVLTVDNPPLGTLDDGDLMMHSLFDTPKEVAIRDSTYQDTPTELRRWKPER
jgi:hypothetical protein